MSSSKKETEVVQVKDILEIVLTKADGTIITNEPVMITKELLEKVLEESKNVHEKK